MSPNTTDCLPLVHQRPSDCLAAPVEAGQGAGTCSDMLRGELSNPLGFWVVSCHCFVAFLPTSGVRMERRA